VASAEREHVSASPAVSSVDASPDEGILTLETQPDSPPASSSPQGKTPLALLTLEPGEIESVAVDEVQRVAIGNPDVADLSVVSGHELLLQAKTAGSTNLMVWDRAGQHSYNIEVVDRAPEAIAEQLRQLIPQLSLPGISVHREHNKLFLTGVVGRQEDLDRVEQMLSAFKDQVTNLVAVSPSAKPVQGPPASVKLTVQLIEMSRDGTDKFGVDWSDSMTFTETVFPAAAVAGPSLWQRAQDAFRIGAISRTGTGGGLSAVLNFLVSNGKARILAEPKLVASSGKEATAFLGVEVPIITTTNLTSAGTSQSIEFKNTGVELKFSPKVLEGDAANPPIQLGISAKVASIDKSVGITIGGVLVPGFRTRKTDTEIVTRSGESVFISGLLQDEEKKNLSQVPALGSIPVLGSLFRSTEFTTGRTELVVIVTPDLLDGVEASRSGSTAAILDRALEREERLVSSVPPASLQEPSLRYALQIQDRIAKSLRFPSQEQALGMSGRVMLKLHLLRDGTLGEALVAESSGIDSFDQEAVKTAENQAPYPSFPPDIAQSDLWIKVPVLFRP